MLKFSVLAERKKRWRVESDSVHVKCVKGKENDGNLLDLLNKEPFLGDWGSLLWYAFDLMIPSNATRIAV